MKTLKIMALVLMTSMAHAQTAPAGRTSTAKAQVWGGSMYLKINSLEHTAPFTTATITVLKYANGGSLPGPVTKTVWLKNIPAKTVQALDQVKALVIEQGRLATVKQQVDLERNTDDTMAIDRYNRDNDAYQRDKVKFDYAWPSAQAELKKLEQERATPTGQVYSGKEVWDCGLRPGEVPRL